MAKKAAKKVVKRQPSKGRAKAAPRPKAAGRKPSAAARLEAGGRGAAEEGLTRPQRRSGS